MIDPGHITPSPTLSNIQKLTPEADGNYYHTVHSGETLSWISGWYGVSLADLMAWNGLNNASVIRPEQKIDPARQPACNGDIYSQSTNDYTLSQANPDSITGNRNPACH